MNLRSIGKRVFQHKNWLTHCQNNVTGRDIIRLCLQCDISVRLSELTQILSYWVWNLSYIKVSGGIWKSRAPTFKTQLKNIYSQFSDQIWTSVPKKANILHICFQIIPNACSVKVGHIFPTSFFKQQINIWNRNLKNKV